MRLNFFKGLSTRHCPWMPRPGRWFAIVRSFFYNIYISFIPRNTRQSKAPQVAHRLRFVGSTTFWPFWISGLRGFLGFGRRSWRSWRLGRLGRLGRLVMANDARHYPSALRNRGPILEALQEILPAKEGQEDS